MINKIELRIGNRYLLDGEIRTVETGSDIDNLPDNAMPIVLNEENLNKYFIKTHDNYWNYKGTIYIWRNSRASQLLNKAFGADQPLLFKNTIVLMEDFRDHVLKGRVTYLHEFENFIFFYMMERREE